MVKWLAIVRKNRSSIFSQLKFQLQSSVKTLYNPDFETTQEHLEEILLDLVDNYLFLSLEDNSEQTIAAMILRLFNDLYENKSENVLNEYKELAAKLAENRPQATFGKNPIVKSEMDEETLQKKKEIEELPSEDEDGFMCVKK